MCGYPPVRHIYTLKYFEDAFKILSESLLLGHLSHRLVPNEWYLKDLFQRPLVATPHKHQIELNHFVPIK